jgi:GNAT superfamily N-acetyltransferase
VDTLRLTTPKTDSEWDAYHRIREHVLWELRGQYGVYDRSGPDEFRDENHPKILLQSAKAVGVVRIDLIEETQEAAFRKVAIIPEDQRKGYGKRLMKLSEDFAFSKGYTKYFANVSLDAVEFYRKIGYSPDPSHSEYVPSYPRMIKNISTNKPV